MISKIGAGETQRYHPLIFIRSSIDFNEKAILLVAPSLFLRTRSNPLVINNGNTKHNGIGSGKLRFGSSRDYFKKDHAVCASDSRIDASHAQKSRPKLQGWLCTNHGSAT
jgi:hypothetical protein